MDFPKAAAQVPLAMLVFIAAVTVMVPPMMAAGPAAEATGIAVWLENILSPVVAGMAPIAIVIVLIVIGLVISQFVANIPVMVIFFAIGTAMLVDTPISMLAYGIVVTFMCSISVATPASAITTAMYYSAEHTTVRSAFKSNLVFIVLSAIIMVAFVIPFASAIF
jgi:sodium-dependent dicarboxylate transporter 2/3/5